MASTQSNSNLGQKGQLDEQDKLSNSSSVMMKLLMGEDSPQQEREIWRATTQEANLGQFDQSNDKHSDFYFGFQTGNFRDITVNQENLDKAMFQYQSQQQQDFLDMKMDSLESLPCFTFGFVNATGKPIIMSPSILRQGQIMLRSQNHEEESLSPEQLPVRDSWRISPARISSFKKSPGTAITTQARRVMPNLYNSPVKTQTTKRLLIMDTSKSKKKSGFTAKRLIVPRSNLPTCRLNQLQDKDIDLSSYRLPVLLVHCQKNCSMLECVFCKNGLENVTSDQVLDLLGMKYGDQFREMFTQWYRQVTFKLYKYSMYYPYLENKKMNATNLLFQLESKFLSHSTKIVQPFGSRLQTGNICDGTTVNVIVMSIQLIQQKGFYLVQLSDGWNSFYVPVKTGTRPQKNGYYIKQLIYKNRLKVGTKVQISNWRQYPILRILEYLNCPHQLPCIQIFYNLLIKLPSNAKLGQSKTLFYKPISGCHPACGLIQRCRLLLIRMYLVTDTDDLYLRVADDSHTYLLQVRSGAGLEEQFRQKEQYQFSKLKMVSSDRLQSVRLTRFEQVKTTLVLENVLRQLLWNTSSTRQIRKSYDLILNVTGIQNKLITGTSQHQNVKINLSGFLRPPSASVSSLLMIEVRFEGQESDGFMCFTATLLTKALSHSKHSLYQQVMGRHQHMLVQQVRVQH